MLDEIEYGELSVVHASCLTSIKHEREARGTSLEAIDLASHYGPALRLYEQLTGVVLADAEELRHHRDSLLGPDCHACGRALRSPRARSCVECGEEFEEDSPISEAATHSWLRRQLVMALTNLSAPGPRALAAMSKGTLRPDELALEFDAVCAAAIGSFGSRWSETQLTAVRRVDELLERMSEKGNGSLWTEEAVVSHPRWAEVREAAGRARAALEEFRT